MEQNSLIEGVSKLRSGSLLEIVTAILIFIGVTSILSVIAIGITGVFVMLVIFLIAILTDILGILRIRKGFSILNTAGLGTGIGSIGALLILLGPLLEFIGVILLIPAALSGNILCSVGSFTGLNIGGEVIGFIGLILLIIGFYKVGSYFNNGTVKIGSILLILGVIGFIVLYLGLGSVLNSLKSGTFPGVTTGATVIPSQAGVYQQGQGTIRGGIAYITLYATAPVGISYASIQGTNYYATQFSISPQQLMQGINQVVINFGNISLTPGMQYTIIIGLSNGTAVYATVVAQ
ncbi:MAG: DUF973 family protein [Sulfolobaceae archaeon]